jgi:hypothetical protein
MIAKVIAWGRDRDEAIARLRRAIAASTVVVEGGTTNRSFLLSLLDRPELREGRFDNRWLDRLVARGEHLPVPDPIAVLLAAIEAYDADHAADAAAFHAAAGRGRPELPEEVGHRVRLRYRGAAYKLGCSAPGRRHTGWTPAMRRGHAGRSTRRPRHAGYLRQPPASTDRRRPQGPSVLIDIDGAVHRVHRDDGGLSARQVRLRHLGARRAG